MEKEEEGDEVKAKYCGPYVYKCLMFPIIEGERETIFQG
jgi:hypothetical protein